MKCKYCKRNIEKNWKTKKGCILCDAEDFHKQLELKEKKKKEI
ncbi:hypothetical protein LCGC14_1837150 [marine sediment metagenome]|uniref:Uncharacterized protein n=1 Tax=marine sediment metagenome TaxID=412755 RepID=A0A0F9GEH3_9ZZZZ